MKKLILLLSLIAFIAIGFCNTGIAQEEQKEIIEYVTSTDIEKLADKYIYIISEKLEKPAEYVYETLLTQAKIRARSFMIIDVTALLLFIVTLMWIVLKDIWDEQWGIPVLLGAFFIIFFSSTLVPIITAYNNPEYYVIQQVLEALQPPS